MPKQTINPESNAMIVIGIWLYSENTPVIIRATIVAIIGAIT